MILVLANVIPKVDCEEKLINAAMELVDLSKEEAGNLDYNFYGSLTDNKFLFVEKWEDMSALNIHLQSTHFKTFDNLSKELSEDMEIEIFDANSLNLYE